MKISSNLYNYSSKQNNTLSQKHCNTSFNGAFKKTIQFLSLGAFLSYAISDLSSDTFRKTYIPDITSENNWEKNVKVLASNSQRYVSYGLDSKEFSKVNAKMFGAYGNEVLNNIMKPEVKSLVDAHNIIAKKGMVAGDTLSGGFIIDKEKYPQCNEFPVSTPNDIDCWNKDDKTKQRFVIAIGGSEDRMTHDVNEFTDGISQIYNVPKENIIKVTKGDKESIEKALKELSEKVKDLNKNNAEILIYSFAHGSVKNMFLLRWLTHFQKEGAAKGRNETGINEEYLQNYIKENFNDINTLIIMDSCLSGAWICDNNMPKDTCHYNQFA